MLDLNIRDLRKQALIKFPAKPEGHVFTVHRLGAGSELELSKLTREANKLILELESNPDEKRLSTIFEKINKLDEARLRIKASTLDDHGDQSLSYELAKELSSDELTKLIQSVEKGESIENAEAAAS